MIGATEDHQSPAREDVSRSSSCFIPAFPVGSGITLPPGSEVIGREWFEARGHIDRQISTGHFAVSRPGGNPHIEDAGSRNGTWVHGLRLAPAERVPLADGALVR